MDPRNAVRFDRTIGRAFYRVHAALYRATGGLIGAKSPEGPMLLLTTTGRKSGKERTSVMLTMPDGDRYVVVGSNGGRPQTPAWVLNLRANPEVRVQVGRRRFRARARIVEGAERDELWPRLTAFYPGWAHYQTLTDRTIHPVALEPIE